MAKRLGVSRSTLNRLEAADQNTTLRTLDRLCRALKRSPATYSAGADNVASHDRERRSLKRSPGRLRSWRPLRCSDSAPLSEMSRWARALVSSGDGFPSVPTKPIQNESTHLQASAAQRSGVTKQ